MKATGLVWNSETCCNNRLFLFVKKGSKEEIFLSKNKNAKRFIRKSSEEVFKNLETEQGLSSNEAAKQAMNTDAMNWWGENPLMKLLSKFKDLMILILLIAAISVVTSGGEDIADAIIIRQVIINAIFGVYSEGKAEEAISYQIYV